MSSTSENNKRIAKNTLMLYFRMLLLLLVSLYTSRVVLATLGVEDYGIYNVVGGVVAMFSLVSGSLSNAISRFLTFELGRGDIDKLKRVFSASVTIQIVLSIIIVVLVETIGVWFLNTHMVIPPSRMTAANWLLQFSIITFVINLISVPYNASIIAHEKMSAFAYISIIEAVGKLGVAFAIVHSPIDRLIFYAILITFIAVFIRLIYGWYCHHHFVECHYHFLWDKDLLRQMSSFAGWNFFGFSAIIIHNHGISILMNLFFGVTVNAARGVATRLDSVIKQFITNYTMAVNPQITKYCAKEDYENLHVLVCRSAKFATLLMFMFAVPLAVEADSILNIWLKNPPEHSAIFVKLSLIGTLVDTSLANSSIASIMATGDIKKFQLIVFCFGIASLITTMIGYYLGLPPYSAYVIYIIYYSVLLYIRLLLMKEKIYLPVRRFVHDVFYRIFPVAIISLALTFLVHSIMTTGIVRVACVVLINVVITAITSYFISMTKQERAFISEKIKSKLRRF